MRVLGGELGDERVELPSRNTGVPRLERELERRNQLLEMTPRLRRHVDPRRPRHVREVLLDLAFEITTTVVVEQVPLVEREYECAARLEHEVDDANILLADDLAHIEYDDGDLGLFEGGRGAKRCIEVRALREMHPSPDPRGVDEAPHLARNLDLLVDGITGGAGELVDDDPLFTDRPVQQARLTDVGATQDGDTPWPADLLLRDGGHLWEHRHHVVEQICDTTTVQRRYRPRLAEPEAPENGCLRLLPRIVYLVSDQDHGLLRGAQHAHDMLIGARRAHVRIDDEQHSVGEVDRDLGLGRNGCVDAASIRLPAPGVHDRVPAFGPVGLVGDAVAGDAGRVLHDGFTPPENAIDEGRLAHIGAPDDGEHGERRQIDDGVGVDILRVEHFEIVVLEVVLGEPGPQRVRAKHRVFFVNRSNALGEFRVCFGVVVSVVLGHGEILCVTRVSRCAAQAGSTGLIGGSDRLTRHGTHQVHHGGDRLIEVEVGGVEGGDTLGGVHEVDHR